MDPSPIQKPTKPPHPKYFPPPYCRQAQKRHQETVSLKCVESNPARLMHLSETLTDDSSKPLEVKINTYLKKEGESDVTFLIHFLTYSEEAMVQVIGAEELEKPLYFPVPESVQQTLVKYDNNTLKCGDILNPQIANILNGLYTKLGPEFVLVPILSKKQKYFACSSENIKPILLVCFVNSKKVDDALVRLSSELFRYCQTVLLNTIAKEVEAVKNKKFECVLRSVRSLFPHLEEVNSLFANIAFETRKLTNARRSTLYLLDPQNLKFIKTFFDTGNVDKFKTSLRIVGDEKLAKVVATSGKIINIKNAQEHHLFDKSIDAANDTTTRNILCFPIYDENSIIGVVQLCNKKGGDFTYLDVEAVKHFGVFCGLAILHSTLYKRKKETQERTNISYDIILHHRKVNDSDAVTKMTCGLLHMHPQLDQFNFPPKSVMPREMVCFILQMFEDLNFIKIFAMTKNHLSKFLMLMEKSHKNMPYHNWSHTFGITHFGYLCLKKFKLVEKNYLSNLEALAYFLACLCQNLDHRGSNNPFKDKPFKNLSSMYTSQGSITKRHNFSQALIILNSEGCNFLDSLNSSDYALCLNLFRDMVLASDLATHFKVYHEQYNMIARGYDKNNPNHRYIFASLLVTCASLSDHIKDWTDVKQSAAGMIEEFVTLGNIESENGVQPVLLPLEKLRLVPDLQVDFLKTVCLPAFKLLALLFPEAKDLVVKIKENILCWEASKRLFVEEYLAGKSCIEVLKSEELEKRVEKAINALLKPK